MRFYLRRPSPVLSACAQARLTSHFGAPNIQGVSSESGLADLETERLTLNRRFQIFEITASISESEIDIYCRIHYANDVSVFLSNKIHFRTIIAFMSFPFYYEI